MCNLVLACVVDQSELFDTSNTCHDSDENAQNGFNQERQHEGDTENVTSTPVTERTVSSDSKNDTSEKQAVDKTCATECEEKFYNKMLESLAQVMNALMQKC